MSTSASSTTGMTWNATMLPEIDESNSGGISGEQQADHPGADEAQRQGRQPAAAEERLNKSQVQVSTLSDTEQ